MLLFIFWDLGIGGVQRKIVDICRYITEQESFKGTDVHIILSKKKPFTLDEQISLPSVHIHYRPTWFNQKLRVIFPLYILWKMVVLKPKSVVAFLDLASVYTVVAVRLLFWRKIQVILNEDILASAKTESRIKKALIKLFYPLSDTIISPTRAVKYDLVSNFGIAPNKIIVIPNWTVIINNRQQTKKRFDMLFVGRFTKQKNIPFLLQAIKKIKLNYPNIKVCLLGEGEDEGTIRKYVKNNGLETNVLIKKPTHNVRGYLLASKLFVLTSEYEGMPVALLEAKALGIPAVTTNYPGAEEAVKNGKDGFICHTQKEFVERTSDLISNNKLRKQLGRFARKRAKQEFGFSALKNFCQAVVGLK